MANTTNPLTFTQIDRAKPREKEYNLADGKGLSLRVKPNGSKLWLFNYTRPFTTKRTNMSFGSYPVVTLAEARERRKEALVLLSRNIDPKEHWAEEHNQLTQAHEVTLDVVARQWLTVKQTKVSADHATDIIRSLELHVFPELGTTPVHKITAKSTIAVLQPIADKGSLETVRRLCQRLNEVMTFAVNTGLIHHNPLAGIKDAFANPVVKHMPSIPPNELNVLWQTVNSASIKKITRYLLEWQLHTMLRPSEAAGARWDEIDYAEKIWTVPAERMKTKRIHKVPLTRQMLAILDTMRPISGNLVYIFPGDRDKSKPANASTVNAALKRMGFKDILVAHGLRSIASTAMNDHGFDAEEVESGLAHVDQNETRRAYNRSDYLDRRRPLMQWWSDFISDASR